MSVRDASMPLHTSETSCECCYIFSRSVSTGLPYLRLVPVSTIFVVEGLHHQKCTTAGLTPSHPALHPSQFLVSLGGRQLNTSGPNCGPCSTLVATQVFKCGCRRREDEPYTLISVELARWIGRLCIPGRSWTPHSPNCTRITGVVHFVEPLRSV